MDLFSKLKDIYDIYRVVYRESTLLATNRGILVTELTLTFPNSVVLENIVLQPVQV